MNKNEYLNELRSKLRGLPADEIENAIGYYTEYFEEAGADNEAAVMTDLGSPRALSAKIIGYYAVNGSSAIRDGSGGETGDMVDGDRYLTDKYDKSGKNGSGNKHLGSLRDKKKHHSVIWIVILAIFASPIALPLIIAFGAILIAFAAILFSVFVTFFAAGIALLAGGAAILFAGILLITADFASSLFYIGSGLLALAVCAAVTIGTVKLLGITLRGVKVCLGKLLLKKAKTAK